MTNPKPRAVIYTRVSRDDTGEGKSNKRQEEACRQLASLRGWEVVGLEEDISISAYSGKHRPGWGRVLSMIERREVDLILAWQQDRITRTVQELTQIIKLCRDREVSIATASGDLDLTTPAGKAVAQILGSIAEMEVEQKGARQRLANKQRAAQGIPWSSGFRAFGFDMDGTVRNDEAELIRSASESVLNGATLRSVMREWNATPRRNGRQEKKGADWTHRSIKAVLLNPRNAGIATYRGDVIGTGAWEAIISEETHTLLIAKLTDPSRNTRPGKGGGRKPQNLLSSIARCAKCGETVNAGSSRQSPIYQCPGYHVSTYRSEADEAVRGAILAALVTTGPGLLFPSASAAADTGAWEEAQRLRERLNLLGSSFASGAISIEQVETATASLNAQLADVEARLTQTADEPATLIERRREALLHFDSLDLDGQRDLLSRIAVVTLYPKGAGNKRGAVDIKEQVTVFLRVPTRDGGERLIPALDDRSQSED